MNTLDTQQIQALVINLITKKGAALEQLAGSLLKREFLLTKEEFTVTVDKTDLDKNVYAILRQWCDWKNNGLEATVIFQAITRATKDGIIDLEKASKELVKLTKAALYLGMVLMEDLTGCEKLKERLSDATLALSDYHDLKDELATTKDELATTKEELEKVRQELDDLTEEELDDLTEEELDNLTEEELDNLTEEELDNLTKA